MPRRDQWGNLIPTAQDALPNLDPMQEQSLAGSVLDAGLSGLGFIGNVLDTPGSIVRGILKGEPGRALGGIFDPSQRVRGAEFVGGDASTPLFSGTGLAGLGVELAMDPTLLFGGAMARGLGTGAKAVGRGGSKALDVLGHAPLIGPTVQSGRALGNRAIENVSVMGNALFDPTVMGATTRPGQEWARRLYAARQAGDESALDSLYGAFKAGGTDFQQGNQAFRHAAEGTAPVSALSAGEQAALPLVKQGDAAALMGARRAGVDVGELQDYLHRSASNREWDVGRETARGLPGAKPNIPREEILQNLPGKTQSIEQMVADPLISGTARTAPDTATAATHLMQQYGVADPKHAENLAEWLHSLDPRRQKSGFFSKNPATDIEMGRRSLFQKTADADSAVGHLAAHAEVLATKPAGGYSALGVLKEAGLTDEASGRLYEAMVRGGKVQGLPPGVQAVASNWHTALKDAYVSREIGDAMLHGVRAFTAPETLKPVLSVIDSLTNLTKGALTSPFPAFNIRNFVSGIWQNTVLTGGKVLPAAYKETLAFLRDPAHVIKGLSKNPSFAGMADDVATEALRRRVFTSGLLGKGPAQDIVGQAAGESVLSRIPGALPNRKTGVESLTQFGKDWVGVGGEPVGLSVRGVGGATDSTLPMIRAGEKLSNEVEAMNRLSGVVGLLGKGYDVDKAIALTKAAHVDYTKLTGFEREVMRRMVPFYSFMRGNVPWQLKQIADNPGGLVGQSIKFAGKERQEGGFEPPFLAPGTAIPLGPEQNGTRRYLTGLGLPFEQLGDAFSLNQLVGNLSPLIKAPIEGVTNRQLYSGRDLRDLHSRLEDLLGVPVRPGVENAIMNSPISRAVTTAGTLIDPRKSIFDKALNLGTGARVTDVDINKSKRAAMREGMMDELRGAPGVGLFSRLYFRPQDIAQMSPRQAALARLYLSEEARTRQASQQQQQAR